MSFFLTETSASSSSTMAEHLKLRRPTRSQTSPDPVSEIPSLMQSTRSKSVVSSLFLPTDNETTKKKSNPFSQSTLRGLGCTASASQQVSVPALIRSSADWEAKKVKKKKKKSSKRVGNESNKVHHRQLGVVLNEGSGYNMSCGVIQDVWCGPGIGLSADAVGSVDRVVARRNVPARGKIDLEKLNHREPSCTARRTVNPETLSFLDSDSAFISSLPKPDFFGGRSYHHARHPSPEGLAEMMMLQNNLIMGARDRFSEWRLDIDSMSYEQLLELGDKIGYVNTGLKEDEMSRCLRKMKGSIMGNKCIICQEEDDEEMGKLCCGHSFHIECIKQWLVHKNTCPVCKTEATPRC
ncbi:UDP-N-acetylglucosamine--N-acetylmuramyl-(pentapeptide) pyrophosphoryl-undecaprenol N-acetylglucosamine transferase-like [Hibiscus syriacus]|uniref:RING-type E3 ubiquitin transferase n=1 Tax=Hibiscus syriacus TaxID=106335 RepID=A0A6A3B1S8_HIBSY|nr:uncharacterized protein LOC120117288 isoform X1 [Hibiscus syriacus]KAE8710676.1 UDP-N-acetylglucosamine--N-acetylmuramyl-(pentapeptide) pyrophosphoryl-undecaprenol N-acetylglucosamine transferase-like [Hibiscus syriacus]